EMDFDGIKNVQLSPTMDIDLMEAEIATAEVVAVLEDAAPGSPPYPPSFYEAAIPPFTTSSPVDIASEERITKYLDSTSIEFKYTNTTPRSIAVNVKLLMSGGGEVDSFSVDVPADTDEPIVDTREFYESDDIIKLKKLNKVEIEIIV